MQTLEIIKNDDVNLTITLTDVDGDPINLTDSSVVFTVKASPTDTDALIESTQTSHTNASAGITTISLVPTDTDVDPGVYYYDFQITDGNSRIQSTEIGKIIVSQDNT